MAFFEVRGLSVQFSGLVVLQDANLVINHSEIVGLIGPNGAGKTTLLNCVSGTLRPQTGRIIFNGRAITGMPPPPPSRPAIARTFPPVHPFTTPSLPRHT